jgi:hypothetical protein
MPGSLDDPFSTPADCRKRAAECERLAAMPSMKPHRETFRIIAANWRKIADDIEARERPQN